MADVPGTSRPVPFLVREGVSPVRSRERREEVARSVRRFLKSLWYSPALIAVLVFVLGAPRKIPK
jgi:hypothetical protein